VYDPPAISIQASASSDFECGKLFSFQTSEGYSECYTSEGGNLPPTLVILLSSARTFLIFARRTLAICELLK